MSPRPLVSIIVPCYNEEATIGLLLDAIVRQTLPMQEMEVILADGMSTDGTREKVAEFQAEHPELSVCIVDNPARNIPAGLNTALRTGRGAYFVRLDAHSIPNADYVERSLADLQAGLGDNVGGIWLIRPGGEGWAARSIAVAASHPLGVGDAFYRFAVQPRSVDTVPFGAFSRSLVERIGMFDETLLTNEDYEFNARLRKSGGTVWLDPDIRAVYFARSNFSALARQYWRYGTWKWRMLRRYPDTLRWRQALPPVFVLGLLALILATPFWQPAGWTLLGVLVVYFGILLAASLPGAVKRKDVGLMIGMPLAIASMHLCWGAGFLASMAGFGRKKIG